MDLFTPRPEPIEYILTGKTESVLPFLENYKGTQKELKKLINAKDDDERTALHWLCSIVHKLNLQIALKFIECGAEVDTADDMGTSTLISACSTNQLKLAKLLIEKGAQINHRDKNGRTALSFASAKGNLEIARMLIENNAKVNLGDKRKQTPLHKSILSARAPLALIQLFIENGASIDRLDSEGMSPLHYACEDATEENFEKILFLIKYGADLDNENSKKKNPLDLIRGKNLKKKVLQLIQQEQEKQKKENKNEKEIEK
ncbi:ankyrin repeat-containing protein [Anaeramoeba flamelloides]|uniref:Ankyrin repeat-containing protein n=1 Tax=Anaeramoeba flamelloides TaxID=1746091 RepID=A0AAV7Z9W9_9EUKA|nr:ankyrin repeat-containing protein [Anaeramoeba flamelloides]